MADFDKIKINGVPYNVKDTATAQAVAQVEKAIAETNKTVQQQGQQITQNITAINNNLAIHVDAQSGDATAAIQSALTSANPGGTVHFTSGETYIVSSTLTFNGSINIDLNGCIIKASPAFSGNSLLSDDGTHSGGGSIYGNGTLECDHKVNTAILFNDELHFDVHNITIRNPVVNMISILLGYEVNVHNCHLFTGDGYITSVGINCATWDCLFSNLTIVNCDHAFDFTGGNNIVSLVHAWCTSKSLVSDTNCFAYVNNKYNCFYSCTIDTYTTGFYMVYGTEVFVSNLLWYVGTSNTLATDVQIFYGNTVYATLSGAYAQPVEGITQRLCNQQFIGRAENLALNGFVDCIGRGYVMQPQSCILASSSDTSIVNTVTKNAGFTTINLMVTVNNTNPGDYVLATVPEQCRPPVSIFGICGTSEQAYKVTGVCAVDITNSGIITVHANSSFSTNPTFTINLTFQNNPL